AIDPLNPATALQTRLSGGGWFVSTSYDLNHAQNVAAPTIPSVTDGSEALPVAQAMRLTFEDWDGRRWLAERTHDGDGHDAFALSPLDPSAASTCASVSQNTTKTNCITQRIAFLEPDGTKAWAQIVPAAAVVPTVTAEVPPVVTGGSVQHLTAIAKSSLGT